jgi:hypothetical protein
MGHVKMAGPGFVNDGKDQCKKCDKKIWHAIFHMVPGINPRPISALQLRCWAWYGSLGLIPGPIWEMSCNNLLTITVHTIKYSQANFHCDKVNSKSATRLFCRSFSNLFWFSKLDYLYFTAVNAILKTNWSFLLPNASYNCC